MKLKLKSSVGNKMLARLVRLWFSHWNSVQWSGINTILASDFLDSWLPAEAGQVGL